MRFPFLERTELLLGEGALEHLAVSHVLVLGTGGVGAYAAEMLVRAGIGEITLADGDTVSFSNLNRQLPALRSTMGRLKTEVLKERFLDINPELKIHTADRFLHPGEEDSLFPGKYDYAVDAIDSVSAKVDFILWCLKKQLPLISSMGAGARTDLSKITETDISKTCNDGLARAVRTRLVKAGVRKGVRVIFSPELPQKSAAREQTPDAAGKRLATGTVSYYPAVFGCWCASSVLNGLLNPQTEPDCSSKSQVLDHEKP